MVAVKLTAIAVVFNDKMYAPMDRYFSEWLLEKMNHKGFSQSDLARKADISRQAISDYLNQRRKPDNEALRKIAHAFQLPEEIVFLAAGELTSKSDIDEDFEELKYLFNQMSIEEQDEFLAIGRLKIERRKGDRRDSPQTRPAHV